MFNNYWLQLRCRENQKNGEKIIFKEIMTRTYERYKSK